MDGADPTPETIERHVAALARASNPSEVFRRLLDGCRLGAPRVAVFLVRQGRLKGWGCQGYPQPAARKLRGCSLDAGTVWLGRALDGDAPEIVSRQPGEPSAPVHEPPAAEAHALPIRVAGRTLGLLLAERGPDDPPCRPSLLLLLVTVSRLKLELDLTWRKLRGKPAQAPAEAHPPPSPAKPPAAPEVAEQASLAPVPERGAAEAVDTRRNEARGFARLVATDIRLYNEEAVMLGRRNRDLAVRLGDQLERGRVMFSRRFADLGNEGLALLQEAYVQVLAAGDPSLLRPSGPA